MLILSMISAAPISTSWRPPDSKKRLFSEFSVAEVDEAEKSPKRLRGSYKYHDHANGSKAPLRKYYIVVCPQSKQKVESEQYSDPKATWTVGFVQAEKESDLSGKILCGYRTVQTQPPAKPFAGEWEFVVDKNQPRKTGLCQAVANISKTKKHPCLIIGVATMTVVTLQKQINPKVYDAVIKHHSDKLPNLVSVYQYLIHLEKVLKEPSLKDINKHPLVTNLEFDISDSSEFMKAFRKMILVKGSAAGFQLNSSHPWELDLYNRIEKEKLKVPDMVKDQNKKEMEIRENFAKKFREQQWEAFLKAHPLAPENQDAGNWTSGTAR
ncbi:hypothetical protein FB446DRAFT_787776 [Lentinula raphanica]|nr:hypothetical protein FB446DRAFT_787776 [Lentinula raphanica]